MSEETAGDRLRAARRKAKLSAAELGRRAAQVLGRDRPISASAVRNQENGTNGLPTSTALAYGEVLDVDPSWLVWGELANEAGPPAEPGATEEAAADDGSDSAIPAGWLISARWLTPLFNSGMKAEDATLWLHINGWNARTEELKAYEVLDHTLEPTFRRGARLVIAPADHAILYNGAFVLAAKFAGSEIHQSIRQVRDSEIAVLLMGLGPGAGPDIVLYRDNEVAEDVWIDGVVIAVVDILPTRGHYVFVPRPKWMQEEDDPAEAETAEQRREALREMRRRFELPDEDFEGVPLEKHWQIGDEQDQ